MPETDGRMVAWMDLDEGQWARAFETDSADAEAMHRLTASCHKAGARGGKILPDGVHPTVAAAGLTAVRPAALTWDAGTDGGAPTVTARGAAGWLLLPAGWRQVCHGPDWPACLARAHALAEEAGAARYCVLAEGTTPDEHETDTP